MEALVWLTLMVLTAPWWSGLLESWMKALFLQDVFSQNSAIEALTFFGGEAGQMTPRNLCAHSFPARRCSHRNCGELSAMLTNLAIELSINSIISNLVRHFRGMSVSWNRSWHDPQSSKHKARYYGYKNLEIAGCVPLVRPPLLADAGRTSEF